MLCDAHNHLQDARFDIFRQGVMVSELVKLGWHHMVVNGTHPSDWGSVWELSVAFPHFIVPSYGLHPWKVKDAEEGWFEALVEQLNAAKGPVGVGEIGLDRWIENPDTLAQEEAFRRQLALATERNLPVTIHCLKAWGPLLEVLRAEPLPKRGFLIHSVNASPEVISELAEMGGYFSVSGPFIEPGRKRYQEALRAIPLDRLLIETDAPDMLPPESHRLVKLTDAATGEELCHPANLLAIYVFVREFLGLSDEVLLTTVFENFHRFFLGVGGAPQT
jgi:TatD DNase family protein